MGNYLVRFLGGEEGVSLPIYPVFKVINYQTAQGQSFIIQLSNERNVEVGRYFGIKGGYRVSEALNCSFLFTE